MRVLPIAGLLLLLTACRSILGIEEDPPEVRPGCTTSAACADPTPICLPEVGACVQCTTDDPAACGDRTPVCDGASHTCVACRAHADCASGACLPDGSCADESQVAYIDGAAPMTAEPCTRAAPCPRLAVALGFLQPRPYIKVLPGTVIEQGETELFNRTVTIVADPGAVITRTGSGTGLRIDGAASRVTIQDLALSNIMGGGAAVMIKNGELTLSRVTISNNEGRGVEAQGGVIRISRSRIAGNAQGGISLSNSTAGFEVVGNLILGNGNGSTSSGGIRINTSQAVTTRLEHNSFHGNLTGSGGAAIDCDAGAMQARNNIVSGLPVTPAQVQLGGSCTHAYSLFFQLPDANFPLGMENKKQDPLYEDPAAGDLHVQPSSPARGAADPVTAFDALSELDIDGDRRTSPADIGADQVR